jgi:molybdopterin/thiamine biosynthesis adenylyltransferase
VSPDSFGDPGDEVRVVFYRSRGSDLSRGEPVVEGFVRTHSEWRKASVQMLPLRTDLFARHQGLYETDVVADKTVAIFGGGSVGGEVGLNTAQCAINSMLLADKDRYDVPNVARQIAPVSYVGRYKTRAVADILREKNPFIDVKCFEFEVSRKTKELVREIVRQADVVVCALDEPPARRVINEVCVEEGKACVYGGLRSRAYGGQVLFVEPGKSPCLACYEAEMPESAADRRISRPERAKSYTYSDLPVPVEPGLALDIKPIALMMTKLVLQYLLRGKETTLRSLDEDLVASLYIWFSRRQPGTLFARLVPLGFEMSGMHILSWYGIPLERRSDCPVCGDFVGRTAERYGIDPREVDAGICD